jgi:uncharacterized protein (TIGR00159 family)
LEGAIVFGLSFSDILDIGIVAFLIYQVLNMIKGTKAVQMLMGLVFLFVLYYISQLLRLPTLNWVLDDFLRSLILIIIVLFQNDIRKLLMSVGTNPFFGEMSQTEESKVIEEAVVACQILAARRIGALIVFQRNVGLRTYVDTGTVLDARLSKELLQSIFATSSPLHDGALIVQHGRAKSAGCLLPLSMNPLLSRTLGTRHRAGLGITEETDAVVLVVSEERGSVSLAVDGQLYLDLEPVEIQDRLRGLFEVSSTRGRYIEWIVRNLKAWKQAFSVP